MGVQLVLAPCQGFFVKAPVRFHGTRSRFTVQLF